MTRCDEPAPLAESVRSAGPWSGGASGRTAATRSTAGAAAADRHTDDRALDQAAVDFAARAGALADLLQRWRRPAVARTVIACLLADDADTFRELLRDFDPPLAGKCWWVREVVERLVATVEARSVCRLRTDLTPGERRLYLWLAMRFREIAHVIGHAGGAVQAEGAVGPEIPPGAFLDALRAEGLVVCSDESVEGAGLQQVLARPARLCV